MSSFLNALKVRPIFGSIGLAVGDSRVFLLFNSSSVTVSCPGLHFTRKINQQQRRSCFITPVLPPYQHLSRQNQSRHFSSGRSCGSLFKAECCHHHRDIATFNNNQASSISFSSTSGLPFGTPGRNHLLVRKDEGGLVPRRQGSKRRMPSLGINLEAIKTQVDLLVKEHPLLLFSKTWCPFCNKVKTLFKDLGLSYHAVELDIMETGKIDPGTSWGLGGTCVNVGCIPKKLFHQAVLLGQNMGDASSFGWNLPALPNHEWAQLVENVQMYIKSLNWGYRVALKDASVTYLNEYARFVDAHTIETVNKKGKKQTLTSKRGFDQQIAEMIGDHMEGHGVKFYRGWVPTEIVKIEEGTPPKLLVRAKETNGDETIEVEVNTVLLAIGRDPCTKALTLENAGVQLSKSGKIITNEADQSTSSNIFAIGDVAEGRSELTPVVIHAGNLLAKNGLGKDSEPVGGGDRAEKRYSDKPDSCHRSKLYWLMVLLLLFSMIGNSYQCSLTDTCEACVSKNCYMVVFANADDDGGDEMICLDDVRGVNFAKRIIYPGSSLFCPLASSVPSSNSNNNIISNSNNKLSSGGGGGGGDMKSSLFDEEEEDEKEKEVESEDDDDGDSLIWLFVSLPIICLSIALTVYYYYRKYCNAYKKQIDDDVDAII